MNNWPTPWGSLHLSCFPYDADPQRRAWDEADVLLLNELADARLPVDSLVIVYNDAFGALTCALLLAGYKVAQVSDSALSQRSTLWNLEANNLDDENLFLLDSLSVPSGKDVLFKVTANKELMEFQFHQIAQFMTPDARLIASGPSDLEELVPRMEKILGPARSIPAATGFFAFQVQKTGNPSIKNPYPRRWNLPSLGVRLVQHAGVFSPGVLHPVTQLLLEHFPRLETLKGKVVDLGCGNGTLGLAVARLSSEAAVYCVDESFLAVWSARETFRANELGGRGKFLCGDGLEDFDKASVNVILCHPPLQFQNTPSLAVAQKMFADAERVLAPGGELWVATERSQGLHLTLGKYFSQLSTAAATKTAVVFCAKKDR
jgi:16S rRNA (guanine1207-N2)-methyltransferase